jgi:hypothetical protein
LARYLRLAGFDTTYAPDLDDPDLARISTGERRIILTRDVGLLKRSAVTHGYYVRATDPRRQVTEVVRRFHLSEYIDPFTRCMTCNGTLEPITKEAIIDRLPPETRRHVDHFHICSACNAIYWQGAHHTELLRIVEAARRADTE